MHAVIQTGGKQYRVREGEVLSVEKLAAAPGEKIGFDQVLLIEDGDDVRIGTPLVENALVRAEVLELYKDEKVLVFKKKRRKQYRRTKGHRQQLTKIRVDRIFPDVREAGEEILAAKPAETPAAAPPAHAPAPEPTAAPAPRRTRKAPEPAPAKEKKSRTPRAKAKE